MNDTTALQKRIRRALSIPAEWARRRDGEATMEQSERWRKRQDEQIAALIAAEVRKGQAEAWDRCVSAAYTPEGRVTHGPNPYRATEAGGRA